MIGGSKLMDRRWIVVVEALLKRHLRLLIRLVGVILSAYWLADISNGLLAARLYPSNESALRPGSRSARESGSILNETPRPEAVDFNQILARNLFDSTGPAEAIVPVSEGMTAGGEWVDPLAECEPGGTDYTLLGTIYSSIEALSIASIGRKGAEAGEAYRVGDLLVDNGPKIRKIDADRVEIIRDGRCELLLLDQNAAATIGTAAPTEAAIGNAGVAAASVSGIPDPNASIIAPNMVRKVGEDRWEICQEAIASALQNTPVLMTQARIVPNFTKGAPDGFRLFSIRPNSPYALLGLRNGDVIQKINGLALDSMEKGMQIFSRLKSERSFSIDLVRRNEPRSFNYEVTGC